MSDSIERDIWLVCSNTAIRRASRRLGLLFDQALAPGGLHATQFALLKQIEYRGLPTMKNLAEAMVMDPSALTHTLKPLIRDGLMELVADASDGRIKRAKLTNVVRARLLNLTTMWQKAQDKFEAAFGDSQSADLRFLLSHIASPDFAAFFDDEMT